MCLTPRLMFVKGSGFKKSYPFIVGCGKCYDCQNQQRGEFVLRAKNEFDNSACAFFLTLSYSDNNLCYYTEDLRRTAQMELERINKLPLNIPFKYDNFILVPRHASDFLKRMQTNLKKLSKHLLFRAVIVGEYGEFDHRPHLHALFFSPVSFTKKSFTELVERCWRYGFVEVSPVTESRIAYVGKHFIKADVGCELQNKVSPRFMKRSVYKGGLGYRLQYDKCIKDNFQNDIFFTYNSSGYKIPIPRFIRRRFLGDKPFSESQISEMSTKNIDNFCLQNGLKGSVMETFVSQQDPTHKIVSISSLYPLYNQGQRISFNKKITYKKQHFAKKVLSLSRKGYFERNRFNY